MKLDNLKENKFSLYAICLLVAAIAAFNVLYCLSCGKIEEWDEARRGVAALEMVQSGNFTANTYLGQLDYWSVKPPLGLWLMSASYEVFGPSRFALRFPSAISALLTLLIVFITGRRLYGLYAGIAAAAILATIFPFIHVHSARAGEYDAPLAFLIALTVCLLSGRKVTSWSIALLGVILGAVFLLKSFSIIIPILLFLVWMQINGRRSGWSLKHIFGALFIAFIIIGVWAVCRFHIDGLEFFKRMWGNDLAGRTLEPVEGHEKSYSYYFVRIFMQNLWWTAYALLLCILRIKEKSLFKVSFEPLIIAWVGIPFVIATLMQTKLPWYINPLYPGLAVVLGALTASGMKAWKGMILPAFAAAFIIGEARIIDKIIKNNKFPDDQAVLSMIPRSEGQVIAATEWTQSQRFIALVEKAMKIETVKDAQAFIRQSPTGTFLFLNTSLKVDDLPRKLSLVGSKGPYSLYRLVD